MLFWKKTRRSLKRMVFFLDMKGRELALLSRPSRLYQTHTVSVSKVGDTGKDTVSRSTVPLRVQRRKRYHMLVQYFQSFQPTIHRRWWYVPGSRQSLLASRQPLEAVSLYCFWTASPLPLHCLSIASLLPLYLLSIPCT